MIPPMFRVDVFEQLREFGSGQLYTINLVVEELENLAGGKGRDAGHARLALCLVKKEGIKILHASGRNTDAAIKRLALKGYYTVCTQDKDLIKSLNGMELHAITLRQKKYLAEL
jgi:rRNA-processing protein FCF1